MTTRQTLSTRKRRVRLTALAGFVVFIGSLVLVSFDPINASNLDPLRVVALVLGAIGLGVALVTLTLANGFAFRCPSCRGNLASIVEPLGPFFAVDRRIKCCPFCRADLDSEPLPGKPQIDPAWDRLSRQTILRIEEGSMDSNSLEDAIETIRGLVRSPRSRCVIWNEGAAHESTLMGTRDGYLNLALALLGFVADAEAGRCERTDELETPWDDRIKGVLHDLPSADQTWIVGTELFASHDEFMAELSRIVDPTLPPGSRLLNDPQFRDPSNPA